LKNGGEIQAGALSREHGDHEVSIHVSCIGGIAFALSPSSAQGAQKQALLLGERKRPSHLSVRGHTKQLS
jgi:hypothetical protein